MFEAAVIVAPGFQKICLQQALLLRHTPEAYRGPAGSRPEADRKLTGEQYWNVTYRRLAEFNQCYIEKPASSSPNACQPAPAHISIDLYIITKVPISLSKSKISDIKKPIPS